MCLFSYGICVWIGHCRFATLLTLKPWEPGEPFDPLGPSVRKLGLLYAVQTGLSLLHGPGSQRVKLLVKIQFGTLFCVAALCRRSVLTQMS